MGITPTRLRGTICLDKPSLTKTNPITFLDKVDHGLMSRRHIRMMGIGLVRPKYSGDSIKFLQIVVLVAVDSFPKSSLGQEFFGENVANWHLFKLSISEVKSEFLFEQSCSDRMTDTQRRPNQRQLFAHSPRLVDEYRGVTSPCFTFAKMIPLPNQTVVCVCCVLCVCVACCVLCVCVVCVCCVVCCVLCVVCVTFK